jgi:hypothetical protein
MLGDHRLLERNFIRLSDASEACVLRGVTECWGILQNELKNKDAGGFFQNELKNKAGLAAPAHACMEFSGQNAGDFFQYELKNMAGLSAAGNACVGFQGGFFQNAFKNKAGLLRVCSLVLLSANSVIPDFTRPQSLRRFRSWSQDARARASAGDSTPNTPVANSSVDSTQNSGSGMGEGAQPHQPQQPPSSLKSAGKKLEAGFNNTISEPYLDHDESKPLIYGYLRKFGRNGQWQKRFFETNGERLTYYKSVKRTKALATLDLCQVGSLCFSRYL